MLTIFSAVNTFVFLPLYPIWAIVVIAVDPVVIWALINRSQSVITSTSIPRDAARA